MAAVVFALAAKQGHHVLHGEVLDGLATLDSCVGELALCFLEFEDTLFYGVVDGEAVDCYIDGLVEAVDAVYCLFFDELFCVSFEKGRSGLGAFARFGSCEN
jgi:hypothetical protein